MQALIHSLEDRLAETDSRIEALEHEIHVERASKAAFSGHGDKIRAVLDKWLPFTSLPEVSMQTTTAPSMPPAASLAGKVQRASRASATAASARGRLEELATRMVDTPYASRAARRATVRREAKVPE